VEMVLEVNVQPVVVKLHVADREQRRLLRARRHSCR
jgi:hypothetical protein